MRAGGGGMRAGEKTVTMRRDTLRVAGRLLWLAFARELGAVPDPVVPAASLALAAVAALVLANLMAALPGRSAARTPAAMVLRAE